MAENSKHSSKEVDPAEAELGLIGFLLCFPANHFQVQGVRPQHFSDQTRGEAWGILTQLVDEKGPGATRQLYTDRLCRAGVFTQDGARAFIIQAQDQCRDAAQPESSGGTFGDHVTDRAMRRQMRAMGATLNEAASSAPDKTALRNVVHQETASLLAFDTSNASKSLGETLQDELVRLDKQQAGAVGILPCVKTIADMTPEGYVGGDVLVVGGRPSQGKTSICTQWAWDWSVEQGLPGAIASLEMPKPLLAQRMLAQATGVPLPKIRMNTMSAFERRTYIDAIERLMAAPLEIIDVRRADGRVQQKSIYDITADFRYLRNRMPLKFVMIDYLQKVLGQRKKGESRESEVASVSAMLKVIAVEMDVVMVAAAQLNRGSAKEGKRRPTMSDLRESGAIEQDADFVMLLHNWSNPERRDTQTQERCELIIDKVRNGRTGIARMWFERERMTFDARLEDEGGDSEPPADAA